MEKEISCYLLWLFGTVVAGSFQALTLELGFHGWFHTQISEMETLLCSRLSEVLWEQSKLQEREIIYVKLIVYRLSCFQGGSRSLTKHSALFIVYLSFICPLFILQLAELNDIEIWVAARGFISTKSFGPEV